MTLTPGERKIYDLLLDGYAHSLTELRGVVGDDLNDRGNSAQMQVSRLRKKLQPVGLNVALHFVNGRAFFALTRFLSRRS